MFNVKKMLANLDRVLKVVIWGSSVDFTFDTARCASEAEKGYLNATDLADLLVARGVAFRDAHELVGRAVDRAVQLGCELQDLPAHEQQRLLPQLQGDLRQSLAATAVLARRDVQGGTAPARVVVEVERWQRQLVEWQRAAPEAQGQ